MTNQENEQPKKPHDTAIPGRLLSLRSVSIAASVVAILVGCLVLLGWVLDVEILKRIIPGLNAMNPTTAIAFVLAGLSLLLLRDDQTSQRRRSAQGCALAVALVGVLKLVKLLFG